MSETINEIMGLEKTSRKLTQKLNLGRSWPLLGTGLGRSWNSSGRFWLPLGLFLEVQNLAFLQHWPKMGSKRPSGSILGSLDEDLDDFCVLLYHLLLLFFLLLINELAMQLFLLLLLLHLLPFLLMLLVLPLPLRILLLLRVLLLLLHLKTHPTVIKRSTNSSELPSPLLKLNQIRK